MCFSMIHLQTESFELVGLTGLSAEALCGSWVVAPGTAEREPCANHTSARQESDITGVAIAVRSFGDRYWKPV